METPAAQQPAQETAASVETDSAPVQATEEVAEPVKDRAESEPEWFTKRFGEITAKFRGEERARLAAEQKAFELEQRLAQSQPKQEEKVKTLADFEYDEAKFQGYVVEQAKKAAREAASEADRERQEQISAERRARKFKEREVAFEKETKDYRDVAHYAPISDDLAQVIQDLEAGPELAYYLGKNRDIALTLNDLPVHLAAVELGRIDAKITAEKAAKAAALEAARQAKAVSGAPPPAPQIDGSNATVDKDPSQMSDVEFAKWRRKQIAARR
jgi:hypothetical protein